MNRILIITPHYPPSNLAAVHRSRLFAQHLPSFGWEPIILTVHEDFYEERLDWNLLALLPTNQRIEKVKAYKVYKPRLIGDIGLRGFFQLRRRALELLKSEKIDFVYIPIPSFYTALIGPYLFKKTGVKYGIDYIDPWVRQFPGSNKIFSRHWLSSQLAKFLEPTAVKYASLITGVSEGYYHAVLERNPHLTKQAITAAMPFGGEERDHEFVRGDVGREMWDCRCQKSDGRCQKSDGRGQNFLKRSSTSSTTSTSSTGSTFKFVYAGAMLPKAYKPLEEIFKALQHYAKQLNKSTAQQIQIHFIGTLGTIKPLAEKNGLFGKTVFEHADRIPYLDVLKELEAVDAVFILGSTEPHYTPSKVYQGVLSGKPILAVLHEQSSAVKVLQDSNAGIVITMNGEEDLDTLGNRFIESLKKLIELSVVYDPNKINKDAFENYTAKAVTKLLVEALEKLRN